MLEHLCSVDLDSHRLAILSKTTSPTRLSHMGCFMSQSFSQNSATHRYSGRPDSDFRRTRIPFASGMFHHLVGDQKTYSFSLQPCNQLANCSINRQINCFSVSFAGLIDE